MPVKPVIKSLKLFLDDRGYLYEIFREDDPHYTKFGQAYISTINPGAVKGFHAHKNKTDIITCVSGQVKFVIVDGTSDGDLTNLYEVHMSPMNRNLVIIPPGLWHGWMCVGTKEAILVNVTTEAFHEDNKDEVRVDPINNPWGYKWEIKHG